MLKIYEDFFKVEKFFIVVKEIMFNGFYKICMLFVSSVEKW